MKTESSIKKKTQAWQDALIHAISDPAELIEYLDLPSHCLSGALKAAQQFPLRVPRSFLDKMTKGDESDPLLKQILPISKELVVKQEYSLDPLNEIDTNPIPGLLHKYKSRVLITVASACAINCRYCFRRHFPYAENTLGPEAWQKILAYLISHPEINEVIFSGGDPLLANDDYLAKISQNIYALPQINRLRIHTRLPIVIPERLTREMLSWLIHPGKQAVLVLHCNHPNEIDLVLKKRLGVFKRAGVTLLNQSVLLSGVNDDATLLATLSEKLFDFGVMPYYLHLLDKVQGAAHFDLPLAQAKIIYEELSCLLPGFLLPKLVTEQPGKMHKTSV